MNSNPKHLELCVQLRCTFGAIMFTTPLFNPYNGYKSKETVFTFSFGGEHRTYHVNIHLNRCRTSSFFGLHGPQCCVCTNALMQYERKCCVCYVCVCYVPYVCVCVMLRTLRMLHMLGM